MLKKTLICLALCLAGSAHAVELRDATNQQILDELSLRLRTGGGGGTGTSFATNIACNGSYLKVSIYDASFQTLDSVEDFLGNDCQAHLDVMPFNGSSGRLRAGQQFAFCSNSYMQVHGVLQDGTLKRISDIFQGSATACWVAVRAFNSDNQRN